MAAAKKKTAKKTAKKQTAKNRAAQPPVLAVAATVDVAKASAIVGQVLTHFGAGYGAQRQKESGSGPLTSLQIFATPVDLAGFHFLLLDSVLRNFDSLNWDIDQPGRDTVCKTAFEHGVLARKQVVADSDGTDRLFLVQILSTLKTTQKLFCNVKGAGGGKVCDF